MYRPFRTGFTANRKPGYGLASGFVAPDRSGSGDVLCHRVFHKFDEAGVAQAAPALFTRLSCPRDRLRMLAMPLRLTT